MNNYFGFGSFTDFINALNKDLPVDCVAIQQINPGKRGVSFCYSIVMTSQAQPTGVIYHQFRTSSFHMIGGQSLGDEHTARAESGYTATLELLNGFTIRKALQAFPKNLKYLEGTNERLRYDKEKDLFFLNAVVEIEA